MEICVPVKYLLFFLSKYFLKQFLQRIFKQILKIFHSYHLERRMQKSLGGFFPFTFEDSCTQMSNDIYHTSFCR